ncbi:hypothetical protein GCM10025870_16850 [Agromyces marinus]|uniref:Uncharacterized protein n=1 Tax=Agromyces marinus TaxID=1389020 RepID=A0ABN6YB75_9MICO|nr:hypothetical protein GCM10025870_16850 [Agromyces marinus]
MHGHVDDAAVAERGERRTGEAAGPDEQHAHLRPVLDAALGEIERQAHERTPLGADPRAVLHLARGLRGPLEQPLELGRGRALGARAFERASHLTGDLALADDDRFEPRRDREQVAGDGVAVHEAEGRPQLVGGEPCDLADRADRVVHRPDGRLALGDVEVEVGLEAVAGRDDDRAADGLLGAREPRNGVFGGRREPFEHVEAGVLVARGQADEHRTILPGVETAPDRPGRGSSGWAPARCAWREVRRPGGPT